MTSKCEIGPKRIRSQIKGLLIKRFHRTKRNVKGFIAEILLPIFFVFLAMLVTKMAPNESDPAPMILHPWFWSKTNHIFQSFSSNQIDRRSSLILKSFVESPSFGTRCVESTVFDKEKFPCTSNDPFFYNQTISEEIQRALDLVDFNRTKISPSCDCWQKAQMCPVGASGPPPSFRKTETDDIFFNLQDFNVTDWLTNISVFVFNFDFDEISLFRLVKTEFRLEFLMKRFGGFEILPGSPVEQIDILNENLIALLFNVTNTPVTNRTVVDGKNIVELFRVFPPKASVSHREILI